MPCIRWFNIEVDKFVQLDYCLSLGTLFSRQLDPKIKYFNIKLGINWMYETSVITSV